MGGAGAVARRDFVAGSVGGAASVVVGQPFDTIKVRVQAQPTSAALSARQMLALTLREEGARALFKGMAAPVAATAAINAIVFAVKGAVLATIHPAASPAPLWAVVLSGNLAGLCTTVVGTPMELVKCRLQVQKSGTEGAAPRYSGNLDCLRQTVRHRGLRGLYTGHAAMSLRECVAFGVYFGAYDAGKRGLVRATGLRSDAAAVQMTAGAASGALTWFTVCPVDVVKSRIQTQADTGRGAGAQGTVATVREMLAEAEREGLGRRGYFYRGVGPAMLRGVPANAMLFFVYEQVIAAWALDDEPP